MWHFLGQVFRWYGHNVQTSPGYEGWLPLLGDHVVIVLEALAVSLAVAMPLALWLGHTGKGSFVAINVTNVGRAIPALAVLTIGSQIFGVSEWPALLALVLLSIPPIITNTYTGLRQVDPDVRDAARGMGMTGLQMLVRVEIPSSLPLIFAGIRTAAVQGVAVAALAAYVSTNCLGTLIRYAISVNDHVELFAVALLIVALALFTEYSLATLQWAVTPKGVRIGAPRRVRNSARVANSSLIDVA